MTQYHAFTESSVVEYVKDYTEFFHVSDTLTAVEFGDGNLNLVFRVSNQEGKSVIVKQALPYARCVGESWPLTLDRARIEAEVLIEHGKVCPDLTVQVLHHDADLAVTVLEDLGHMEILRGAQISGKQFSNLGKDIGNYLARTAFYSSDFYLSAQVKKAKVGQFLNPELCQITEDLFFNDPYTNHERNNFPIELAPLVDALANDETLKFNVAQLKAKFLSSPQALLHGDVHTGSIFVTATQTKVIDPEFGFFGPIGFDIGSFIANLLLNYCAQNALIDDSSARTSMQAHLLSVIDDCYTQFESTFTELLVRETTDNNFANTRYQAHFLQSVLHDAIGFAGTELVRRTIGLAHVKDIDGITDDAARLAVQSQTVVLGRELINTASTFNSFADFKNRLLTLVN